MIIAFFPFVIHFPFQLVNFNTQSNSKF